MSKSCACDNCTWLASDFVNNQMPTSLDGVSVTMNGVTDYIYYISPTEVNLLAPPILLRVWLKFR